MIYLAKVGCIRCLRSCLEILEELTCPLKMALSQVASLTESLPVFTVRLELLAHSHFPVPVWQLEVLNLLKGKEVLAPKIASAQD